MISIVYTDTFDGFLKKFDEKKQELIKKVIIDYCDHKILLPRPKSSALRKQIQKVAIPEVGVVIFYLDLHNTWILLTGIEIFDRVA